ncbi:ANTAR domain-containing protein [Actinomycetospora sp. TBRC 11914]|uniref:ANTAR domain-containing protein n=1 Tax=Actinomycetospora sp. TBRC 11914 TaxID=2729387 RepID=UPI00145C6277|nr:ANTAR domain-containing protein [Actinomycetospora sp. TBRC 11914]NMO92296.1 ANTAR domain-containing protein [Actinomycetospora sp. TBRC 11914]
MRSGDRLVVALREAGKELVRAPRPDLDATLDQIVTSAVALIDAADEGGLSRTHQVTGRASHATSEIVNELDRLQDELDEGPCITAAEDPPPDGLILARDLAGSDGARWPRFAAKAVQAGFRCLLSAQLSSGRESRRSSLNLYSRTPDAFSAEDEVTAGLFALQAGTLMYGADTAAGLNRALANRDMIGRAKGLLMERFAVGDEAAFQMLVTASQDTNMKLAEVARWLTEEAEERARGGSESGDTPTPTPR